MNSLKMVNNNRLSNEALQFLLAVYSFVLTYT